MAKAWQLPQPAGRCVQAEEGRNALCRRGGGWIEEAREENPTVPGEGEVGKQAKAA